MPKKIRVLQILPSFVTGGAERFVVQLMQSLDQNAFDVRALSLYGRQETQLESLLDRHQLTATYLNKTPGFDPRMFASVHRSIKEYEPDIIHTHLHAFRYLIPAMVSKAVTGFVHTVHSVAERERRRIGKWFPQLLFGRRVVPVAIAAEVQRSIQRVYGVESVLIPNGIPLDTYRHCSASRTQWRKQEGFAPDDVLLLCVGRFDPVKNHRLLIDSFAQTARESPNVHLLLAGDGHLRASLQAQVALLGLQDQVHFLGVRDDVPTLLSAADLFLFASDSEGSPLSLMEAMAAGLPIIGTAVGGVREMVSGEASVLVNAGDREALAAAINRISRDGERRKAMGRQASEQAVRFDVASMALAYQSLYARLLEPIEGREALPLRPESGIS